MKDELFEFKLCSCIAKCEQTSELTWSLFTADYPEAFMKESLQAVIRLVRATGLTTVSLCSNDSSPGITVFLLRWRIQRRNILPKMFCWTLMMNSLYTIFACPRVDYYNNSLQLIKSAVTWKINKSFTRLLAHCKFNSHCLNYLHMTSPDLVQGPK